MSRQWYNCSKPLLANRMSMLVNRPSPNIQQTLVTNIPQQLVAVLPSVNHSSSQSQGGNGSDSFSNFAALTLHSSPKSSDIWLAQEQLTKTVTDSQHTIATVCTNYLFPCVKFLHHKSDLEFSYNRKSICQHVLEQCNLAPSVNKQEWWNNNVRQLNVTFTSMRNNKTHSIHTSFYGMFCNGWYCLLPYISQSLLAFPEWF